MDDEDTKIAVLVPCYNEEASIGQVVSDFKRVFPRAGVYVYDNGSVDNTVQVAEKSGAIVRHVRNRGKGNVIRKMFADISADVYIMVDGDATYTAEDAVRMVEELRNDKSDMVVAVRKPQNDGAYPMFHIFGNRLFNFIMKILFGGEFHDVFSGYRAFSKRFVKTFPVTTNGFDIEAELSIHALTLSIPCSEIDSKYLARKRGSHSKLNTIKDGFHILISILRLFVDNKPLWFFGMISLLFAMLACSLFFPLLINYVNRVEIAALDLVLPLGITIISILSLSCGLTLRAAAKIQLEVKRLLYLSM